MEGTAHDPATEQPGPTEAEAQALEHDEWRCDHWHGGRFTPAAPWPADAVVWEAALVPHRHLTWEQRQLDLSTRSDRPIDQVDAVASAYEGRSVEWAGLNYRCSGGEVVGG
jgi:hypothetical protein